VSFNLETVQYLSISGGFSHFCTGGIQSNVTVSAMSILSCLSVNMARNAFDGNVSSRAVSSYIEMLGAGTKTGLEMLASLYLNGEVLTPTSPVQVDIAYAVMLSSAATLMELQPVMHLHKDKQVRLVALTVRDEIINTLSSSTALGQVLAYLSTSPISMSLQTKSFLRELSQPTESVDISSENTKESKYGQWGRFVTPKRASQKLQEREAEKAKHANDAKGELGNNTANTDSASFCAVADVALSLLLVWGRHAEYMVISTGGQPQNSISQSPCNLLLSRAPPSSIENRSQPNVSNLSIIASYMSMNLEHLSSSALLASKLIKMCLRYSSVAAQCSSGVSGEQVLISSFPSAFSGCVSAISQALVSSLKKLYGESDDHFPQMEQMSVFTNINLETIALSVNQQPELARKILVGDEGSNGIKLVDEIVTSIESTVSLINAMNRKEQVDKRVLRLRCALANSCLEVISELWKTCRLGSLSDFHACGGIVKHLTTDNGKCPLVANLVVELARYSLFAILSQEDGNSLMDDITIESMDEKIILLDLLSKSLSFLTYETLARMQTSPEKGIGYIAELFQAGPMECWIFLLTSNQATSLAASAWADIKCSWSIESFCQACPSETSRDSYHLCSLDLALSVIRSASGDLHHNEAAMAVRRWNALNALTQAETLYAASWSQLFDVIITNAASSQPPKEVSTLTCSLIDGVLVALKSISETKMIAQSLLSAQDFVWTQSMKPLEELSSLLLSSLSARSRLEPNDSYESQEVLRMLGDIYESLSRVFVLTEMWSAGDVNMVRA
jgi:hypothetical protein